MIPFIILSQFAKFAIKIAKNYFNVFCHII